MTSSKVQLLEERRTLVRANETAEQQITELPDEVRSSLAGIIRAGIESNTAKITRIDEELRRIALTEEHERCISINNKVLNLVNTYILGELTGEELDTLAKCSGISIRFTRDKETGQVSATSSVGSAGRAPRGSSSDKPGEPREKRARRMIYDKVIGRRFSTWAGVLSAYGLAANGSSALKVASAMFKDFSTRFVDDDNINFVEELLDKTVPYTIGTSDDAYDEGYVPDQIIGGTPVHPDDMPSGQQAPENPTAGTTHVETVEPTEADTQADETAANTDKPSGRHRKQR